MIYHTDCGLTAAGTGANTPGSLYMYNPSDFGSASTTHPANTGLNYSVTISGASP